jgi:hypothetical protein
VLIVVTKTSDLAHESIRKELRNLRRNQKGLLLLPSRYEKKKADSDRL